MNNKKIKLTDELETVEVEGGKYTLVVTRIKHLANNFDYEIETESEFIEALNSWKVKATLIIYETTEKGEVIKKKSTGHACEEIGASDINATSALENAETSAVGRACAFRGIGLLTAIASADEVKSANEKIKSVKTTRRTSAGKSAEEKALEKLKG